MNTIMYQDLERLSTELNIEVWDMTVEELIKELSQLELI